MSKGLVRIGTAAVAVITAVSAPATAQEMWLGSDTSSGVAIEILRPSVKSYAGEQTLGSVAVFLTARSRSGADGTFVVEVPWASAGYRSSAAVSPSFAQYGTALGSPYIGYEGGRDGSRAFAEVGVRLPYLGYGRAEAITVGRLADLERTDAYYAQLFTMSAFANYRVLAPGGLRLRLRAGPVASFAAPGGFSSLQITMAYAAQAGYEASTLVVLAGVSGRAVATAGDLHTSGAQAVTSVSLRLGRFRPGVSLRLPLDRARRELVGATIGLGLALDLP